MADTNLTKNKEGYGYKYTDLAQIHEYLEENNMRYYQYVETTDGKDYIMTVPIIDGVEQKPRRGVQIVDAVLNGIKNPAQEQGSATTYARRYSLLMAFGLATEDDDGASLTQQKNKNKNYEKKSDNTKISEADAQRVKELMLEQGWSVQKLLQKNYKINDTTELNTRQYASIINAIKKAKESKKHE